MRDLIMGYFYLISDAQFNAFHLKFNLNESIHDQMLVHPVFLRMRRSGYEQMCIGENGEINNVN